jgi:2-polyprenyl-3-methyl-5-hydroxy-6-metoxy-1,4-benzoquinol methylase
VTSAPPETLEAVACAVCGADDVSYLHRKATPEGEVFPVVRCRRCSLVYVNPRRRQETLAEIYKKSVYFQGTTEMASGYSDYIGDREIHVMFFDQQLATLERHVKPGKLLDVGCAVGFLLDTARRRGWKTAGVELSEFASNYARSELKLDVKSGTLKGAKYPAGAFDAVMMDDVIEHFGDPEREMREVHRVLKTGGVVLLHTPNAESPWYKLTRKHWVHLKPGEHLYYFSPRTLTQMLEHIGFRVLSWKPSGKTTRLEYVVGRVKFYNRPVGTLLSAIASLLPFTRRPFPFRSGEFELVARKA